MFTNQNTNCFLPRVSTPFPYSFLSLNFQNMKYAALLCIDIGEEVKHTIHSCQNPLFNYLENNVFNVVPAIKSKTQTIAQYKEIWMKKENENLNY